MIFKFLIKLTKKLLFFLNKKNVIGITNSSLLKLLILYMSYYMLYSVSPIFNIFDVYFQSTMINCMYERNYYFIIIFYVMPWFFISTYLVITFIFALYLILYILVINNFFLFRVIFFLLIIDYFEFFELESFFFLKGFVLFLNNLILEIIAVNSFKAKNLTSFTSFTYCVVSQWKIVILLLLLCMIIVYSLFFFFYLYRFLLGKNYRGQFDLFFNMYNTYFNLSSIYNVITNLRLSLYTIYEFFYVSVFLVFLSYLYSSNFYFIHYFITCCCIFVYVIIKHSYELYTGRKFFVDLSDLLIFLYFFFYFLLF